LAKSFDEFEEHWREFLRRLERIWNKSEAHYRRSPKWNGWKGKFEALRREDELLLYLYQARGAEEHSVAELVQHEPGSLAIKAGPSGSVHIRRMQMAGNRIELEVLGEPPVIELTPSRVKLLPVTNRGRTYSPPTKHLGVDIDPTRVIEAAELAIAFYDELLKKADVEFVK
jgi:hypothetical protein